MDRLDDILINVLRGYVTKGLNGYTELTQNADSDLFTLIATGDDGQKRFTFTAIIVRVIADTIIIEEDRNNKPLYEALMQAGIPREKIILAYAGEQVPAQLT